MKYLALLALVATTAAHAATAITDPEALRRRMGVAEYLSQSATQGRLRDVKVAVLDNGFEGFEANRGMLPNSAEMPKLSEIPAAPTRHGLAMAQIVWAVAGGTVDGPKFYLLNTNGYTNFKAAIDYVVQNHVDIVVYSQVWPFGSNFDGHGFINAQVNRALQAGTMWINAAGNNGGLVYNGSVLSQKEQGGDYILFGNPLSKDHLTFKTTLDETNAQITLSWTDFQDTDAYNTKKDLDIFVFDQSGKLVGSGELVQRGEAPPATGGDGTLSSHARETVVLQNLERGEYRIQIRVKSPDTFVATDKFRVLIKSEKPVEFPDASHDGELFAPADNAGVLTVGERFEQSAAGPTADGRQKPEVMIDDATVAYTSGEENRGTSNAAAMVAGAVALMKAQETGLSSALLRSYVAGLRGGSSGGPGSDDPNLQPGDVRDIDPWIRALIPGGSRIMKHRRGYSVVLTPSDPLMYSQIRGAGASRKQADDILLASAVKHHFVTLPRSKESLVEAPLVEFRQAGANVNPNPQPQPGVASPSWRTPSVADLRRLISIGPR